jgi:hypothetical protein
MEWRIIFDDVSKILYVWVHGEANIDGMMLLQNEILSEKHLPTKLKILEFGSREKSKLNNSDVELLLKSMNEKTCIFESVRHAMVQFNMINTSQSMLAELYADRKHCIIKVFSTERSAKNWLMMS